MPSSRAAADRLPLQSRRAWVIRQASARSSHARKLVRSWPPSAKSWVWRRKRWKSSTVAGGFSWLPAGSMSGLSKDWAGFVKVLIRSRVRAAWVLGFGSAGSTPSAARSPRSRTDGKSIQITESTLRESTKRARSPWPKIGQGFAQGEFGGHLITA